MTREIRELKCLRCDTRFQVEIESGSPQAVFAEAGRVLGDNLAAHVREKHSGNWVTLGAEK